LIGLFGKGQKNEQKKFVKLKKKQLKKLVKENQYDKVLKIGAEILEKDPDELDVLFILGGVFYMKGMFKKAISYFDKVLEISSYDSESLILKANALVKLGKLNEAKICCNKIKEIDPKNKGVEELMQKISEFENKM